MQSLVQMFKFQFLGKNIMNPMAEIISSIEENNIFWAYDNLNLETTMDDFAFPAK